MEREEITRKQDNVECESLSISSFSLHFLFIFSLSLDFLTGQLPSATRQAICREHQSSARVK